MQATRVDAAGHGQEGRVAFEIGGTAIAAVASSRDIRIMLRSDERSIHSLLCAALRGATVTVAGAAMAAAAAGTDDGYTIQGFVGQNSMTPAPMVQVVLIDAATRRPLATAQTNFFGKYSFAKLPPGQYTLQVADVMRQVVVVNQSVRLDIDLSAKGGVMDYAAGAAAAGAASAGAGAAPTGPHDPTLAQQIAGTWWGYSGSTERKIGLCPGGAYRQFSESGYSGRGSDSLGNPTMAWGTASQGSSTGTWTISGSTQSGTIHVSYSNGRSAALRYRQIGDPGCLDIDGNRLCRTSKACE
jgi:hypothetical protein